MSVSPVGDSGASVLPVRRRGLRDEVYDRILGQLLGGALVPGQRLSIDTIARQLEVSPTPVREALVQLERTGLVSREALRGYRIAPPLGPEQMSELLEARMMLETTAVALAMDDPARHEELVERLEEAKSAHERAGRRLVAAVSTGLDPALSRDYFDRDQDFHTTFLDLAGNRYVAEMFASLGALTHRMRQSLTRGDNDVTEAVAEHAAIVDAVRTGDRAAAVSAMRHHIQRVRERSVADK